MGAAAQRRADAQQAQWQCSLPQGLDGWFETCWQPYAGQAQCNTGSTADNQWVASNRLEYLARRTACTAVTRKDHDTQYIHCGDDGGIGHGSQGDAP
ncbi:hypothetical protein D3C79_704020 [compost metagenome]